MTDADVWRQAQQVFESVLDDKPVDRGARVRRLCGENRELEKIVLDLLVADGQRVHMPDEAPLSDFEEILDPEAQRERWIGRQLGSYEIMRELGRGGMGSVFLAERRDEEFEKEVAIKLVRFEFAGEEGLEQFRTERQLLAGLEHPYVARLLDGGTTEEGIPYLVMEYVDGAPIAQFCDAQKLSLDERLELFRKVCVAVQYAHRNLIVHRDLKASNILVTSNGTPKLLDFGIAKLLDRTGVSATQTVTLSRRLTPEYASPEQILGGAITTASDVYSLGVLLYELLVGQRPHNFEGTGLTELARRVEREAPNRPSEVASKVSDEVAEARGLSAKRLGRRLVGDLDNIVQRALEKDPARRYGSAEQLSDEIERYMSGLPVLARPATIGYRVSRFCRRNAAAVTASSLGLLLLVSFLVLALVQRNVARREMARAEEVTDFLLSAFSEVDPDQARGRDVTVREVLDVSAVRLDRELEDQPDLRATMMLAIGDIYRSLSFYDVAEPLIEQSLKIRQNDLSDDDPRLAEALHAQAELLLDTGDHEEARALARRSYEIRRRADRADAAESLNVLARIRWRLDDREEAIALHREALAWTADHLGMDSPDYIDGLNRLAVALRSRGQYEAAEPVLREALERQRNRIGGDHPTQAEILSELSKLFEAMEDPDQARPLAEEALAMNRRLYGENHPSIVANLNTLGNIEQIAGAAGEAADRYRQSLGMQREFLGERHPRIPGLLYNLATVQHRELGLVADAEADYAEAIEVGRATLGSSHTNLGFFLIGYGDCLTDLGRSGEALGPLSEAQALFQSKDSPRNLALAESALGAAYVALGQPERGRDLIVSSHQVLSESFPPEHRIVRRSQARLDSLGL